MYKQLLRHVKLHETPYRYIRQYLVPRTGSRMLSAGAGHLHLASTKVRARPPFRASVFGTLGNAYNQIWVPNLRGGLMVSLYETQWPASAANQHACLLTPI